MEYIPLFGAAIGAAAPLLQAQSHHHQQITQSLDLHAEAIRQERQHHFQSIFLDIKSAAREMQRDDWAQQNNRAQTLMVTDTLLFGCGFALLIEGMPSVEADEYMVILYSACIALSFMMLFVSIWFSMKLQARMTKFNMSNPMQIYIPCYATHPDFHSYYVCHCSRISHWADVCFYLGAASLLLSAAIMAYTKFTFDFDSEWSAWTFCGMSALSVITLALLQLNLPTETRATAKIGRRRKGVKRSKKEQSMEEQLKTAGEYPDLIEDIMQGGDLLECFEDSMMKREHGAVNGRLATRLGLSRVYSNSNRDLNPDNASSESGSGRPRSHSVGSHPLHPSRSQSLQNLHRHETKGGEEGDEESAADGEGIRRGSLQRTRSRTDYAPMSQRWRVRKATDIAEETLTRANTDTDI